MGIAKLHSAFAKIGRANEHFIMLKSKVVTFGNEHAKSIDLDFRYEGGWHTIYAGPLPAFPQDISLIAGDCLNNIRAALDHIVWQFVLREDQEPTQTNLFPIYEKPEDFADKVKTPTQRGKRNPLCGLPIDGDAWTLIEQAQPFNHPQAQDHPLLLLNQLTKIDKHHSLLVQLTFLDKRKLLKCICWKPGLNPIESDILGVPLSAKRPTVVARFRFPADEDPGMDMEGNLSPSPSIGDRDTQVTLNILGILILHVKEILEQCKTLSRVQS